MSVMPKCEKCGRYFILSDGGPCKCEVKLRLAIRDLYRGDGGPLNDYDQGWNDGTDAAAEVFSAEVEALREDAERYRTKRELDYQKAIGKYVLLMDQETAWKMSYDAAIDAARKEAK